MTRPLSLLALSLSLGCGVEPDASAPTVSVGLNARSIPAVDDVLYTLTMVDASGTLMWSEDISSSEYGDGSGSAAYVGPCDATNGGLNTIELKINELVPLSSTDWVNPGVLSQTFQCLENRDVPVEFDITILRSAGQGFADVAIGFDDIACSAKVDCVDADNKPILLVPGPNGKQLPSAIMAFSCVSDTTDDLLYFYMTSPTVNCGSGESYVIDPTIQGYSAGLFAGNPPYVASQLVSAGLTYDGDATGMYWTTALGLDPLAVSGSTHSDCSLSANFTASREPLDGQAPPPGTVYPVITVDVPLTDTAGSSACSVHSLLGGNGVDVDYSPPTETFIHSLTGALQSGVISK